MNSNNQPPTHDARLVQVGRRVSGYCGHVPQFRAFPPTPSSTPTPGSHAPSGGPSSTSRDAAAAATSPPAAAAPAPTQTNAPTTVYSRPASAAVRVPPRVGSRPQSAAVRPPGADKPAIGFGGHRAGVQFQTGCTINGPRKSDVLTTQMHAEDSNRWKAAMNGATVMPRYPIVRGPSRVTPFGHDVFLSN